MFKNYTLIFMLSLTLFSCGKNKEQPHLLAEPKCIDGQSSCVIVTRFGELGIKFNVEALVAETPFSMFVESSDRSLKVVSGYLTGDDMYMGKIPLFFNEGEAGVYRADSLFGSCANDKMRWKVWLTVSEVENDQLDEHGALSTSPTTQTVFFTIESFRNYQSFLESIH